ASGAGVSPKLHPPGPPDAMATSTSCRSASISPIGWTACSARRSDAMPWWGWIVVGAVLLGAELFVIPTDFYLVFLGTSAIAVGAVAWTGLISSSSVEWILFAALAAVSLVFFRARFPRLIA